MFLKRARGHYYHASFDAVVVVFPNAGVRGVFPLAVFVFSAVDTPRMWLDV